MTNTDSVPSDTAALSAVPLGVLVDVLVILAFWS